MKISQFSQIGKRSNNEDSLGTSAALLTVCDGMGGHNYGERASAFVKEAMLKAFAEPQPIGKMEIQQALNKVQQDLNQLLETEPELEKMGTTFTGVFRTPDVWYAAHIGDSRIYLFRPSEQKLWHTWDHSLVGELMRTKEITVEAGRFHPMSNRISKAIIAQKDGKPANASIVKIDELKAGDIFMLCSDGVVEGWGDWELVQLFSDETLSFEQKCKKLAAQCAAKSKDNNTAIIAEIEEADAFSFGNNDELEWTTFEVVKADYEQYVKDNEEVSEEAHKSESPKQEVLQAPKADKPKPDNHNVGGPKTQPLAVSRQAQNPPIKRATDKKPVSNWLPLLAVLLLVAVGLTFLLKDKKPVPVDHDTKAFEACQSVTDFRAYLAEYGPDALHYAEAKAFVENCEADSAQKALERKREADAKAAQTDLDNRERKAYEACTSIGACDRYLRVYPNGRYVTQVKTMKAQFEEQERDAEAEAQAKAEAKSQQKEDEAYRRCSTIQACEEYLKDYPYGRYKADVQAKKSLLEAQAKEKEEIEKASESKETNETEKPDKTNLEIGKKENPSGADTTKTENAGKSQKDLKALSPDQNEILYQAPNHKSGLGKNKTDTVSKKE